MGSGHDCSAAELLKSGEIDGEQSGWKLNVDEFRLPERGFDRHHQHFHGFSLRRLLRNKRNVSEYYRHQERLLQGFNEMEAIHNHGVSQEDSSEVELMKSERMAVSASNLANALLLGAKVYASIDSGSLAVIASTMDSLLDLISGMILWVTYHVTRKPNLHYRYPIGKKRMEPLGIIVFSTVMATLGLQIIVESIRQLLTKPMLDMDGRHTKWMIGIMVSVTVIKFVLMLYCQKFNSGIVRAYAQDHFFDVVTNSIGLATALLAVHSAQWIDPAGAILIAVYTISTWMRTAIQQVRSIIGTAAPPEYVAKITYLIWNHHREIRHIDTVRAYTFGSHYFVEVDIVLPKDMPLSEAHNIGEMLQEKLERLPDVERAFVHIDFEFTHRPEHNSNNIV